VGFVATVLGVVFVLWPSLKPEGPAPSRRAAVSNVTLERNVAFGQYLDRVKISRASYGPADLARRGVLVEFDYTIEGYKGKRLPLRWQLLDAQSADQVAQSEDLGITAEATTDRGTWPLWVAVPRGATRRFTINIQIYKSGGDVPLSRARTARFPGT
jgi:hypothetical protein